MGEFTGYIAYHFPHNMSIAIEIDETHLIKIACDWIRIQDKSRANAIQLWLAFESRKIKKIEDFEPESSTVEVL
jgi:hypothetical protein